MVKTRYDYSKLRQELETLQNCLTKLEKENALLANAEREKAVIKHSLRERVKELNCLYGVTKLIELHGSSIEKILQGVTELIPGSWQYPEITCVRIRFEGNEYVTSNFRASRWKQTAEIEVAGETVGGLEVYYLRKSPLSFEGPFLKEERLLIDSIAEHIAKASERIKVVHDLEERVKELNCLYEISRLIEGHGNEIDKILKGITAILPRSWLYPEITCARIVLEGKEFLSDFFETSQWKQTSDISIGKNKSGSVEIYYLKEMPTIDEGPFLKEERLLIDAVAERIGRVSERIKAEQQIEIEQTTLKNMNITLREVLSRVQDEKDEIGKRIQGNVDRLIMPILFALENKLSEDKLGYARILKSTLNEIVSPFISNLSREFSSLTPVEIQVCNLIKSGFSTKEIAQLRAISPATVSRHREHIRKKLGINSKSVNLATYLDSFMTE